MIFELETEYIELYKLLKAATLCASGGEAKHCIDSGFVAVNGVVETRRRCKVRHGDRVQFDNEELVLQRVEHPTA